MLDGITIISKDKMDDILKYCYVSMKGVDVLSIYQRLENHIDGIENTEIQSHISMESNFPNLIMQHCNQSLVNLSCLSVEWLKMYIYRLDIFLFGRIS